MDGAAPRLKACLEKWASQRTVYDVAGGGRMTPEQVAEELMQTIGTFVDARQRFDLTRTAEATVIATEQVDTRTRRVTVRGGRQQ